jgi:hypothetical protein
MSAYPIDFALARSLASCRFLIPQLVGSEFRVVEFLSCGDQVEDDAGELMRRRSDGFRRAELGSHTTIEITEGAFAVMQRLGGHA